ncbi:FAD dependent oxidoreductase-domain-containing protein [Hypoxylon sp. NC1633]|nr:FAD dependent oxidoreductase-domain-containing protein [Hypoxylon sp. NC1633]
MGSAQSTAKTFWLAAKALHDLNNQLKALLKRASSPPGFPVKNPTKSYWTQDPPYPELTNIRMELPSNRADIVIIGSGVTAAAVASSVLQESDRGGERPRVVVLEARNICSGATGRNGGHIKSSPHELFATLKKKHGPKRAAALTRFQLAHVKVLTELCQEMGWAVAECREVQTVDLYLTDEDRESAFKKVKDLEKWVPEVGIKVWDAYGAQKVFDVNEYVKGAISYTAGALWPYRFVSCVWKDLLTRYKYFLYLQTNTTVLSVQATKNSEYAYEVTMTDYTIQCNHVVHATNAFATEFVPGLRGKMTGALATMSAQRPGRGFPSRTGKRSWSVVYGQAFDYITQRPSDKGIPGDLMVGGGFSRSEGEGANMIGVWDDGRMDALPVAHISGIFPTIFDPSWGDEAEGGRTKQTWSGVIAVTGDLLPFVGRLKSNLTGRKVDLRRNMATRRKDATKPGEWIAAGYCGDGMVWAWLSGTALGIMIAGTSKVDALRRPGRPGGQLASWFPSELEPSARRVKNAGLENLADRFF